MNVNPDYLALGVSRKELRNLYVEYLWRYDKYIPNKDLEAHEIETVKIRTHLLHLMKECKRCHNKFVLNEIKDDLVYLGERCKKALILANNIMENVKESDPRIRYYMVRIGVFFMFVCLKQQNLFNWKWRPIAVAPTWRRDGKHIFIRARNINGLERYVTYKPHTSGPQTYINHGDWIFDFHINERGGSSRKILPDVVAWHPIGHKLQEKLLKPLHYGPYKKY